MERVLLRRAAGHRNVPYTMPEGSYGSNSQVSKKHGVHIQYCEAGLVKTVILSSGQGGFSLDVIWALGNSLRHHFEPGCLGVP
jgi:hypothetical protein